MTRFINPGSGSDVSINYQTEEKVTITVYLYGTDGNIYIATIDVPKEAIQIQERFLN